MQRRTKARGFDPSTRIYGEIQGKVFGYVSFDNVGRVSFPWTLPGHEHLREPLFQALIAAVQKSGMGRIFAAYREDWPGVHDFFLKHGFHKARDMVNFAINLIDMPTPAAMPSTSFTSLEPQDVPSLLNLAPEVLHTQRIDVLTEYLFKNPYFPPDSLYALRSRSGKEPIAVGILVSDSSYADPKLVDSSMPCFRLGAFGTEGTNAKRIKGLFSFLARQDRSLNHLGMDLLGQASYRLRKWTILKCWQPRCRPMHRGCSISIAATFTVRGAFPSSNVPSVGPVFNRPEYQAGYKPAPPLVHTGTLSSSKSLNGVRIGSGTGAPYGVCIGSGPRGPYGDRMGSGTRATR